MEGTPGLLGGLVVNGVVHYTVSHTLYDGLSLSNNFSLLADFSV